MAFKTRPNVYDTEIWEQVPLEYFPHIINYGGLRTAVDIGGHIGAFTCFVKAQAPRCQVWSVELDTANYWLLQKNTRQWNDVYAYHAFCGYDTTMDSYLKNVNNSGNNALIRRSEYPVIPDGRELMTVLPPRITLETLTQGLEHFDLLKLDCESSEFDILANADRNTLAKFEWIVGEYHSTNADFVALAETLTDFVIVEMGTANDWDKFLLRNKNAH